MSSNDNDRAVQLAFDFSENPEQVPNARVQVPPKPTAPVPTAPVVNAPAHITSAPVPAHSFKTTERPTTSSHVPSTALSAVPPPPLPPLQTERNAAALFMHAVRERHVQTVHAARVSFRPFRATLYSFRVSGGLARVRFHVSFKHAADDVILQAAQLMLCRTKRARKGVPREEYDAFVRALPPAAFQLPGARRATRRSDPGPGKHHCLHASFARINAKYFGGQLAKPELCWSPKRARRILGTYNERVDRLILSKILDAERIPQFVFDYVMYHELLHKHLGIGRHADGRRCVHGADFKRQERRFEHYTQALAWLKKL